MKRIAIISSSVREGRMSHRVALYLAKLAADGGHAVDLLDLKEYAFGLFTERLMYQRSPGEKTLDFAARFTAADAVIVVSPIYNASYPASLKNVVDLLVDEWKNKPVAVCTVTGGGNQAVSTFCELSALLVKLGALVSPVPYMPVHPDTTFDSEGNPADPATTEKYAKPMIEELVWLMKKLDKND